MKTLNNSNQNKVFIIQYDPTDSPQKMFKNFWEAVDTGKPNIQPNNLMLVDSIETAYKIMTKPCLEIFYAIIEKKSVNLSQLAKILAKKEVEVRKDCQVLANLGVIKLEEKDQEVKLTALYDRIVLDFPSKEVFNQKTSTVVLPISH